MGAVPTRPMLPIPGSIITEVALETLQLRVVVPPALIIGGLALK